MDRTSPITIDTRDSGLGIRMDPRAQLRARGSFCLAARLWGRGKTSRFAIRSSSARPPSRGGRFGAPRRSSRDSMASGGGKNIAPLEPCRCAAVLQVRGIAQINWRGLGYLNHWGDIAADRRERLAPRSFSRSRRADFTARCARRLPSAANRSITHIATTARFEFVISTPTRERLELAC
jgi:hypothetical protein